MSDISNNEQALKLSPARDEDTWWLRENRMRKSFNKATLSDMEIAIRDIISGKERCVLDEIVLSVLSYIVGSQECIESSQPILFLIGQGLDLVDQYTNLGDSPTSIWRGHQWIQRVRDELSQLDGFVEQQYELYKEWCDSVSISEFVKYDLYEALSSLIDSLEKE